MSDKTSKCALPDSGPCINRLADNVCDRRAGICLHSPVADAHRNTANVFAECHHWNILHHYLNARAKHPYFADKLVTGETEENAADKLVEVRLCLKHECERGESYAEDLLLCELWEVMEAYAKGDKDAAVSECYDAIAVLLRMVDVLEGRQKLDKPEEAKA